MPFFAGAASPALFSLDYGFVFSGLPSTVRSIDPLLEVFARNKVKSWGAIYQAGDPFSEYLAIALDTGVRQGLFGNAGKMLGKQCEGFETTPVDTRA